MLRRVDSRDGVKVEDVALVAVGVLVLFFPVKNFYAYHLIVSTALLVAIAARARRVRFGLVELTLFLVTLYLLLSGSVAGVRFGSDLVRNVTEPFRFVPLLLLVVAFSHCRLNITAFLNVLFIYVLIATGVSIAQFTGVGPSDWATKLYAGEGHAEVALGIGGRALGLSQGPGQNGEIMVMLYSIFLAASLLGVRYRFSGVAVFCSAIVVLLSQSQSSFLALITVTAYLFSMKTLDWIGKPSKPRILSLATIVASLAAVLYYVWDKLRYLGTLFVQGLGRHSYQARLEKWNGVWEFINQHPLFLLLGHGKDALGTTATAMDNEYLYFLAIYGILATIVIIGVAVFFIARPVLSKTARRDYLLVMLGACFCSGALLAWPASFLTDPKLLLLMGLLYVASRRRGMRIVPAGARRRKGLGANHTLIASDDHAEQVSDSGNIR